MKKITAILTLIFIILLTLTLSIEISAYNKDYYEKSYIENEIVATTGKDMDELLDITDDIIFYLKAKGGEELLTPHFNEKEVLHMDDVLYLFNFARSLKYISIIGLIICGIYFFRSKTMASALSIVIKGLFIFYIILISISLLVASNFSKSFVLFHLLLFDNDLWLLNPKTDLMIQMLPESFFVGMAQSALLNFMILLFISHILIYAIYRFIRKKEKLLY